jgi:hypothetical protein
MIGWLTVVLRLAIAGLKSRRNLLFDLALRHQLLVLSRGSNTVTFTWTTVPGQTYQVVYCSDLKLHMWYDLGNPVAATGTTLSATDALSLPQRYYRVVLLGCW